LHARWIGRQLTGLRAPILPTILENQLFETPPMKTRFNLFLLSSASVLLSLPAAAAPLYKIDNTNDLNQFTSWSTTSGAQTPNPVAFDSSDVWYFNDATMLGSKTVSLGADITIAGIGLDNTTTAVPGNTFNVVISSGNTLTLNGSTISGTGVSGGLGYNTAGIVLNRAVGGTLTIDSNVVVGANQQWVTSRALNVTGTIGLGANTLSFNTAGASNIMTLSGVISGSGSLNKAAGAGTLALGNPDNSFGGTVTLIGGNTTITKLANSGNNSSLGSGASSIILNGATLTYTGGTTDTTDRAIEMRAGAAINNTGAGTITFTAANVIQSGTASARTLTLGGTNTTDNTFASILGDSGTSPNITSLTKNGAGKWILTNSNAYTGTTNVNAGTLVLGNATDTLANNSAVTIGGGTLDIDANNDTVGLVTLNSGTITGTTGTLTGTSYLVGAGSISANLGGTAALAKTGSGTVTLSGTNTYSGGTTVTTGVLTLASSGALGGSGTVSMNGGTLQFSSLNTTDYSSRLRIEDGIAAIFDTNSQNVSFASPIATGVSATGSLTKTGTGTLSLTAANTYTGTTRINQGTVSVTGSGVLGGTTGSSADANNIVFGLNLNSGALQFESVANLGAAGQIRFRNTGGIDGQGGALVYIGTTDQTLGKTIQCDTSIGIRLESDSVGGSLTFNGAFSQTNRRLYLGGVGTGDNTLASDFTGTGGITKRDSGTWTVTSNNSYTGNTVVDNGTLIFDAASSLRFRPTTNGVNNAVAGSETATLTFTGTVSLDLTAATDTPGNSWNLFNIGSFTGPAPTLTPAAVTSTTLGSFTEISAGVWELPVSGAKWVFTTADGTLAYSATGGFSAWALANAPGQTIDQDHDGDGVPNGVEFFMGLSGSSFTANPAPDASTHVISWPKGGSYTGIYGTDYVIQISSDLGIVEDWADVPAGNVTIDGDSVDYDLDTAPNGVRKFARLAVTGP
jgi:autotransporter-associated beta strand protein